MLNGKKHGYGKQINEDGGIYEGFWKEDQEHAYGRSIFPPLEESGSGIVDENGNCEGYEGELVDGQAHGYGMYVHDNGEIYKGMWIEDEKQGKGELIYPNGDIFEGEFDHGEKQGSGIMKFVNGSKYEG